MRHKFEQNEYKRILYWGLRALAEKQNCNFHQLLELALQKEVFLGQGYERNCRAGKMSQGRAKIMMEWLKVNHPSYAEAIELVSERYFNKSRTGSDLIFDSIKHHVQAIDTLKSDKAWSNSKIIEVGGIYLRVSMKNMAKIYAEEYERQMCVLKESKKQLKTPMRLNFFLLPQERRANAMPSLLFEKLSGIVLRNGYETSYKEPSLPLPISKKCKEPEGGPEDENNNSLST